MLRVHRHPSLELGALSASYPAPLGELPELSWLSALLALNPPTTPDTPLGLGPVDAALRAAVRDVLRHGGYKPTGRGKPASEYLVRAAEEGSLRPINRAADVGNVASLHSGLPISVVDLDRTEPPLEVGLAASGATYVFNASGQSMDLGGLLCLSDARGPCANAVKDSQRTKTGPETRRVLLLVWGAREHGARVEATLALATRLFERSEAVTERVALDWVG